MEALYYSTGKAAPALGVTADAIRRLCDAGAIEAEVTEGGQWRIPQEEIERLKRDGLPPVPKPLPARGKSAPPEIEPLTTGNGKHPHSALLAEPSEEAVAAADEVVRLESEVRALGLKRQREEALDWFRQREQDEEDELAEQQKAEAAHDAEDRERDRRQYLQERWLEYALASVPWEAQGEVELQLHAKVKAALVQVDADEPDTVVRRLVDAVVAAVLRPYHRLKEVERVIEDAVFRLPYAANAWEQQARESAREAVERLGMDAPMRKVQETAAEAVERVAERYSATKAAEADADERRRLVQWLPLELREFNEQGRRLALEAVGQAFAKLPVGTPREKLIEARDAALAPFHEALSRRGEMLRAQAAAERAEAAAHQERQLRDAKLRPRPTIVHRAPTITRRPIPPR
jgi:excisionase family DNA binding protein